MNSRYDVIVAGLGAMGSATAAHLATRGKKVLGLERWSPGHRYGSSHGDSRIIREMYFEHPMYVPILGRAYELWAELGQRTGKDLLHVAGGLMIGPEDGMLVTGTRRSAKEYNLAHEVLSPAEVKERYPAFELRSDYVAVLDPRAGYLDPEVCNGAHWAVARELGADLRECEPALSWTADNDGVSVTTPVDTYHADHLVLAVGARTLSLLNGIPLSLEIERQVVFWLEPDIRSRNYDASRFPIYIHEYAEGAVCYGFPRLSRGVKASGMHSGEKSANADEVRRSVNENEVEPLRDALSNILPELASAPVLESDVCIFTNTPDHDFVIDFHPEFPRVVVSSACSGHGFKFASAIGEIQADLVTKGKSRFDLSPFSMARAKINKRSHM